MLINFWIKERQVGNQWRHRLQHNGTPRIPCEALPCLDVFCSFGCFMLRQEPVTNLLWLRLCLVLSWVEMKHAFQFVQLHKLLFFDVYSATRSVTNCILEIIGNLIDPISDTGVFSTSWILPHMRSFSLRENCRKGRHLHENVNFQRPRAKWVLFIVDTYPSTRSSAFARQGLGPSRIYLVIVTLTCTVMYQRVIWCNYTTWLRQNCTQDPGTFLAFQTKIYFCSSFSNRIISFFASFLLILFLCNCTSTPWRLCSHVHQRYFRLRFSCFCMTQQWKTRDWKEYRHWLIYDYGITMILTVALLTCKWHSTA